MASLNLSINGPSIKSSYNGVVTGPPPSATSPTHAQWALFSVQAPLVSAFQDHGAKESVLKVEGTGDGELTDLMEDFNEGRIQFAFVKVTDPNTVLPKCVLIAWCGGGVPERTKGYFTSHTAAVSKVLHGYHIQITARSDADLEPASIMKKVSDASGAKYSAATSNSAAPVGPFPVKSKPVFNPNASSIGHFASPPVAAQPSRDSVDDDGWGADAPPVTRTEIKKVESAYRPTKVNMAELTQKPEPSRFNCSSHQDHGAGDVVTGGYQPIGKVDIAAIRAAAKNQEYDRPTPVKGAYEPVGKIDLAAIRAKAHKSTEVSTDDAHTSHTLADRASVLSQPNQPERIMSLPKPKVANSFAGSSSFTGTRVPAPRGLGFGTSGINAPAPVGSTSRTFADEGGKTPAQVWAEKKARLRGSEPSGATVAMPVTPQKSGAGEWKSGYTGKTWAPVQTSGYSRTGPESMSQQNTEEVERSIEGDSTSSGGVSALRDRFKNVSPIGSPTTTIVSKAAEHEHSPAAPSILDSSRPSGGFAMPGLSSRPPPSPDNENENDLGDDDEHEPSPIQVAVPVSFTANGQMGKLDEQAASPAVLPSQVNVPREELADESEGTHMTRAAGALVAEQECPVGHEIAHMAEQGGKRALIQYDYEKAEDNEIDLVEGEYITDIDMVDEDWWMGRNSKGESGLFPSNYVELIDSEGASITVLSTNPTAGSTLEAGRTAGPCPTATALYDYEAAEDNELSFRENAKITDLEFPDEDWWFGHCNGASGLFPANYVQLDH